MPRTPLKPTEPPRLFVDDFVFFLLIGREGKMTEAGQVESKEK
jgi:hypothetical protein